MTRRTGLALSLVLSFVCLASAACAPARSACVDRVAICADELLDGNFDGLTDNAFYLPQPGAGPAAHRLSGSLTVSAVRMSSSERESSGRYGFPGFAVEFVSVDDVLLPLEREIILGADASEWDIILSPGRVWSEATDNGMSRASFPFTLVTNRWNEAHNGVATFLYDDVSMSGLRLQVTQETAPWNKLDFWAVAPARVTPGRIDPDDPRIRQFQAEQDARVGTKPWPALATDFPAIDMREFTGNVPPGDISSTGVLVGDVVYYQPANTRRGPYPYPLEMRHGVFSVTKSAGAALTLLRLAELYGEDVFDLRVADYVDVTAPHDGWSGVTFGHLLNMVAGIGDRAPEPEALETYADENDEDNPVWDRIWHPVTRAEKLDRAFRFGNYPWGPGEIVRYNSAHTFILGAAMDGFYRTKAGPDANVWTMMKREVYGPIGIGAMPSMMTVGTDPLPINGYGLFLNTYDTARIAQLLHGDGAFGGRQFLHAARTRESLYRTAEAGHETYLRFQGAESARARYLNSFWSFLLDGPEGCSARVPAMWGYGGSFVTLLPNGVMAFRYADAEVHDPVTLATAAASLRPLC